MTEGITSLLQSAMSGDVMDKFTELTDGDKQQTQTATQGAISAIMAAMAKNAKSQDGAQNIARAVQNDHDGSVLDDVIGHLFGDKGNERMLNGEGIIRHTLGNNKDKVADAIGQESGLSRDSVMSLMAKVAPLVMGALGKQNQQRSGGLDISNLAGMLLGGAREQAPSNGTMDMLTAFLDQDGDGSMLDDVTGMLGRLFKK